MVSSVFQIQRRIRALWGILSIPFEIPVPADRGDCPEKLCRDDGVWIDFWVGIVRIHHIRAHTLKSDYEPGESGFIDPLIISMQYSLLIALQS